MIWLDSWLQKFETTRPFSDDEAWLLFRLAAIGEAIGWTLLITSILIKRYLMHGNNAPVLIAGQIHGTLFIIYIAASLVLYPSLGWRRGRALIAGLASVPPYGSLIFEQWMSYSRSRHQFKDRSRVILYEALVQADS